MQINALFVKHGTIFRVLAITDSKALIINCFENKMPYWENIELLDAYDVVTEDELLRATKTGFPSYDSIPQNLIGQMHKKYGTISLIVPYVKSDAERNSAIEICAKTFDVSKASVGIFRKIKKAPCKSYRML